MDSPSDAPVTRAAAHLDARLNEVRADLDRVRAMLDAANARNDGATALEVVRSLNALSAEVTRLEIAKASGIHVADANRDKAPGTRLRGSARGRSERLVDLAMRLAMGGPTNKTRSAYAAEWGISEDQALRDHHELRTQFPNTAKVRERASQFAHRALLYTIETGLQAQGDADVEVRLKAVMATKSALNEYSRLHGLHAAIKIEAEVRPYAQLSDDDLAARRALLADAEVIDVEVVE